MKQESKFDSAASLKTKTQKELLALRDRFSTFILEHGGLHQRFISYLSLIELEFASRIGKK